MVNGLLLSPLTHFAATGATCSEKLFLGLVPWYHYLTNLDANCNVTAFNPLGANSDFLLIMLAIIDDLLRVVGFLSVVFIIMAGLKYMTSQGSPDGVAKAQSTIINSLVGLGISLISIRFVAFIAANIGGTAGGNPSALGLGLDLSSLPNPGGVDNGNIIQIVLSIFFGVLGAIALLIIVIAGMSYVTSQGDAQKVARAKGAIMYALIGLVVAIVAQSIVSAAISKV